MLEFVQGEDTRGGHAKIGLAFHQAQPGPLPGRIQHQAQPVLPFPQNPHQVPQGLGLAVPMAPSPRQEAVVEPDPKIRSLRCLHFQGMEMPRLQVAFQDELRAQRRHARGFGQDSPKINGWLQLVDGIGVGLGKLQRLAPQRPGKARQGLADHLPPRQPMPPASFETRQCLVEIRRRAGLEQQLGIETRRRHRHHHFHPLGCRRHEVEPGQARAFLDGQLHLVQGQSHQFHLVVGREKALPPLARHQGSRGQHAHRRQMTKPGPRLQPGRLSGDIRQPLRQFPVELFETRPPQATLATRGKSRARTRAAFFMSMFGDTLKRQANGTQFATPAHHGVTIGKQGPTRLIQPQQGQGQAHAVPGQVSSPLPGMPEQRERQAVAPAFIPLRQRTQARPTGVVTLRP